MSNAQDVKDFTQATGTECPSAPKAMDAEATRFIRNETLQSLVPEAEYDNQRAALS